MAEIIVKADEATIAATLVKAETFTSLHTGANLRRLTCSFDARGPQQKQMIANLLKKRPRFQVGAGGPPDGSWALGATSYSDVQGGETETHQWELTEDEQIKVDALQLGDNEFTPTHYKETFDDSGILTIIARVRLSREDLEKIKALPPYFSVLRKGLNPAPREMRFGRGPWSPHDGFTKASLTLVDRKGDSPRRPGMLEPLLSNIEVMLVAANERIKILTEALEAKGVTEPALWDGFQKRLEARLAGPLSELWCVGDVDGWLDEDGDVDADAAQGS